LNEGAHDREDCLYRVRRRRPDDSPRAARRRRAITPTRCGTPISCSSRSPRVPSSPRAADILAENGIFIEAGPSKHNNSQGFYLYSYEPGGNRVEIYSGSYLVFAPDWEVVTWNEQERGTGVYWGSPLPESFIEYGTPDVPADTVPARKIPVFDPA
jgi:hypothetical protein